MKSPLQKLRQLIDHLVTKILVELYLYEGDVNPIVNDVQLKFNNGMSFIVGCSGDGGVFVRKGEARIHRQLVGVNQAELRELQEFRKGNIKRVDTTPNSLVLGMSEQTLTFTNKDDELVIYIDGEEKNFHM